MGNADGATAGIQQKDRNAVRGPDGESLTRAIRNKGVEFPVLSGCRGLRIAANDEDFFPVDLSGEDKP
jgi:hypothetical protein